MSTEDADRDTIPCPPPSHIEVISMESLRPWIQPNDVDDSGIFAFTLDCELLDED
jgi:hypothetical protein